MNIKRNKDLLLAIQGGLLGAVTPNLRGVAAEWNNNTIVLYFYYDGPISELDQDNASTIAAETIADFSDAHIEEHYIRSDYPNKMPKHSLWAYRRKEP